MATPRRRHRLLRSGSRRAALLAALTIAGGAASAAGASAITGPDVASYQHPNGAPINWGQVAASGQKFAFVKASEGTGYTNPYYSGDVAGMAANGIYHGAYHYGRPSNDPAGEANHFADVVGNVTGSGTLPPVLDIEQTDGLGPAALTGWIHTFLNTLQARTGRVPMIYTGPYFWRSATGNATDFAQYPLWIASYGVSTPQIPGGWNGYTFWQTTSTATLPGIAGNVDLSTYCCTQQQLDVLANNGTPTPIGAIADLWTKQGGGAGPLGAPVNDEYAVAGGRAEDFAFGRIYWTPATGAHAVQGQILAKYVALGGPAGPVGFPTTDETPTPDGAGRFNHFTGNGVGASIYWTRGTGANEIQGAIRDAWATSGWESGPLGYPTTDETVAADNVAHYNDFSKNATIDWAPATGTHLVYGAIRQAWVASGREAGPLGYPTSDETAVGDGVGRYNDFSKVGSVVWSPATGAHLVYGLIREAWVASGREAGPLGYPTTDETAAADRVGRYNDFSKGGTVAWSPATGAHLVYGMIKQAWVASGR
ncbi:MAG TPA: GH25 family lysozyme, partial [Acidimicrobiia bacterium]|nr:GH25 family lysozyme [Acidimicrobiia bacterium]